MQVKSTHRILRVFGFNKKAVLGVILAATVLSGCNTVERTAAAVGAEVAAIAQRETREKIDLETGLKSSERAEKNTGSKSSERAEGKTGSESNERAEKKTGLESSKRTEGNTGLESSENGERRISLQSGESTEKKTDAEHGANTEKSDPENKQNAEDGSSLENDGNGDNTGGSDKKKDCVLLFAGDVYFSNHVLNAYTKAGGIQGVLDEEIRKEIAAADVFMVNQEFPFTDRGKAAANKQFTFRLPPDKIHILQEMGVDIVTMANNHILDFGPDGITDSLKTLDEAGILHVGAGEDIEQAKRMEIIETCGRRIGFIGVSRVYMAESWAAGAGHPGVFSAYDPSPSLQAVREAKEKVDYLVVYIHWGVERETEPQEYQKVMGRQYIDAGADVVIGSHPHVLQPIETYKEKPIVYSLGNFVFGSSIPSTELFKLTLTEAGMKTEVIPCTSSGGFTRCK